MKWMQTLLLLFIVVFNLALRAEGKHPRVAELEDKLKHDAIQFLEGRFPGVPFAVIVSVDPLRRSFAQSYEVKGEQLPFYALDSERIQDEWDDPTATIYTLGQRVKKVKLTIHVPDSLNTDETAEIQTTLLNILKLIPARDDIQIIQREWTIFPNLKLYLAIAGGSLFLFLLGLLIIARFTAARMARSIEKIKSQGSSSSPASAPSRGLIQKTENNFSKTPSADVRFNDPIKVREVLAGRVNDLVEHGDLMRLENILRINSLGKEDPALLGSVLVQFPVEIQEELFALSKDAFWMEALTHPGEVNFKSLSVIEELSRVKSTPFNKYWELLLLQVWRMDSKASFFLKKLGRDKALSILAAMPKGVSVPLAREIFPGNWAAVLDPKFKVTKLSEDECEQLFEQSLKVMPLMAFETLTTYKNERELLSYLDSTDIRTEREIYEAAHEDSIIRQVRPPFYVIFDANEDGLKYLVEQISISDWATALFNVEREQRKVIESYFTEKEKYFYLEDLKDKDSRGFDKLEVVKVRAAISDLYQQFVENQKSVKEADGTIENINTVDAERLSEDVA